MQLKIKKLSCFAEIAIYLHLWFPIHSNLHARSHYSCKQVEGFGAKTLDNGKEVVHIQA